jgi:ATP-dependent RNA helicase DDX46/PRP5
MVNLIEITGASVTNKGVLRAPIREQSLTSAPAGIFYEPGKEPSGLEDPPKLHLLVESNEEWRVSHWPYFRKFLLI